MDKKIRLLMRYSKILRPRLVERSSFDELRFKCLEDCVDCCKNHLVVIPEKELQEMLKEHSYSTDLSEYIKIIKRDKEGSCVLLKDNRCSIQEIKPLACRGYPFFLDPYTEQVYLDIKCPGIGKGNILQKEEEQEMINCRKKYWDEMKLTTEEKRLISELFFIPNIVKLDD